MNLINDSSRARLYIRFKRYVASRKENEILACVRFEYFLHMKAYFFLRHCLNIAICIFMFFIHLSQSAGTKTPEILNIGVKHATK